MQEAAIGSIYGTLEPSRSEDVRDLSPELLGVIFVGLTEFGRVAGVPNVSTQALLV